MSSPVTPDTLTQAPRSKLVFTLVHGTFAKGADWVMHEKSETFCPTLKALLDQHGRSDGDETRAKFGAAFRSAIDKYEQNERSERDETAGELCKKLRKILDRYVNDESPGRIASAKKALANYKLSRAITKYEKDEATFRTELRKSLPEYDVEFDDRFAWGHRKRTRFLDNTESARSRAIPKLARHLCCNAKNSRASHFVVAHSHAGNIALQAMNDKGARESIAGIVCLATPFLFSRERRIPGRLLVWSVVALTIMGSVLYQQPNFLSAVLRQLLVALMVFYTLVILSVLPSRFLSKARPVRNYRSVKGMDGRLMVIRPSGDEASGLLRTSQFVTWCLGRILARLDWLLGILIGIAVVSRYMRDWIKQMFEWFGTEEAFVGSVMSYVDRLDLDPIFGVLFIAASAIVVLMAVQWLVISFDHVGWFADVEMLAEEAPPGMTSQAVVLEPSREGSQNLVHTGIYNKPQTIQEIASWVKEKAHRPVELAIA